MQTGAVVRSKRFNLFVFVGILSLLGLYYSNPSYCSFKSYIHQHARDYNGPIGSIVTHFNLWHARKANTLNHYDLFFFSVIKSPSYLLKIFNLTKSDRCIFIGILFNWFPVCYSTQFKHKIVLSRCSYRGFAIGSSRCVCLPSWHGDECSKPIAGFNPFLIRKFKNTLLRPLNYISVLEVVLLLALTCEIYFIIHPTKRFRSLCTWSALSDGWKYHTLLTHAFVHKNALHALFAIYSFFACSPHACQILGLKTFLVVLFTVLLMSNAASMLARRMQTSFHCTKFLGLSAVNVAFRGILVYASLSWTDSLLMRLGQICLSHFIVEYVLIGDSLDYAGIMCGLVTGLLVYKCI